MEKRRIDAKSVRRRGFIWSIVGLGFSAVLVTLLGFFGVKPFFAIGAYYITWVIPTIVLLFVSYFIINRIFSGGQDGDD